MKAGEKIGDLAGAIANSNDGGVFNTYKENRYGNLFNKYAASQKEYLAMLGDPNLSDIDKRNVVNELIAGFLKDRKYKGKMPEVIIGTKTEAVDSRYDGNERIFITKEDLNSSDVLSKLGHELGHLNTYDKDEKTAGNIEKKIDVVINTAETNGEYNSQLEKLKDKYKDLPNGEKAIELQNKIPDEYKEKFAVPVPIPVLVGGVVLIGGYYYIQNSEVNKETWNKFQEDIKKEWESVKDKGIAYAEFQKAYMEAFLAKQNIIIGAEEGIGRLPFPDSIPVKLPPILVGGNPEVIEYKPDTNGVPPVSFPTDTADTEGKGKVEEKNIHVGEIPKVEEKNIMVITEKEARQKYKNTLNKTKVEGDYPSYKSNSDILRDQLVKAGVKEPNYSNAAHHIVAALGTGMEEAVIILEKLGIDLNSASNGVFLPTKKANKTDYDTEALHSGPNGRAYKDTVNNKIKKVYEDGIKKGLSKDKITEKVVEEINKIKIELLTGKEKINNAK